MGITGYATGEGTARYRDRMVKGGAHATHFKDGLGGLALSSIGLGTYLGDYDTKTDALYVEAIKQAAASGCNVFDSAINYRCQRSERVIGQALAELVRDKTIARDEAVVATKGGFIPYDGAPPQDPYAFIQKTFVMPGIIDSQDIVAECHCITPSYLRHQLQASLMNLGLDCVDIYYVHNPEMQLDEVPHDEFMKRMRAAFEMLERAATQGKLRVYGTATWNGYRIKPGAQGYLSLESLVKLAEEVGGPQHHFKVIQLPFNLGMLEVLAEQTQTYRGQPVSLLEAAKALDMYVMASATILQGQLAKNLSDQIRKSLGEGTDAQRAIQFVRSTPGMGTALVGMKRAEHVRENLAVASSALLTADQFASLFA
jgi:aryl-alcohol dehydrogenase-like predicted oxidoreductase